MYAVLWLDLTLHENHESSRPTLYPVSSKRTLNLTAVSASGNYVGWSIFPILLLLVFPLSASLINHVRTGFHILYVRSSVCFGRQWKYQCFGFFCDFVLGYQIKLDNKPQKVNRSKLFVQPRIVSCETDQCPPYIPTALPKSHKSKVSSCHFQLGLWIYESFRPPMRTTQQGLILWLSPAHAHPRMLFHTTTYIKAQTHFQNGWRSRSGRLYDW